MKKPNKATIIVLAILLVVALGAIVWLSLSPRFFKNATTVLNNQERIAYSSEQYQELLKKSQHTEATTEPIQLYLAINDLDERVAKLQYHDPDEVLRNSTTDYTTLKTTNLHFIDGPNVYNPRMECSNGEEQPEQITLFTTVANQAVLGGGYSRTAYLCGDEYIVSQFDDAVGIDWVGPFTLE